MSEYWEAKEESGHIARRQNNAEDIMPNFRNILFPNGCIQKESRLAIAPQMDPGIVSTFTFRDRRFRLGPSG